jgi:hypothetical protein
MHGDESLFSTDIGLSLGRVCASGQRSLHTRSQSTDGWMEMPK